MNEEINNNFDINAKYEEMLENAKGIVEHHLFVTDVTCEPPSYISLAYDVKKYLPVLKQQNEFLTKRENKLQTIEQIYKSGSVDLEKLRKIVLEEE